MSRIWVIKLGGTFADLAARDGDFEDWTARGLDLPDRHVEIVNVRSGQALPDPQSPAGVVLTGSHDMVTDRADWSVRTGLWLSRVLAGGRPILGICYGHQLLAEVAGGRVGPNPNGREFGTAEIRLTAAAQADPLIGPLGPSFRAHVCHAQSALSLSDQAVVLAGNDHDPIHAFRLGPNAWGVQFHPEFNSRAAGWYVRQYRDILAAQGCDVEALLAGIVETPKASAVLARFARLAL